MPFGSIIYELKVSVMGRLPKNSPLAFCKGQVGQEIVFKQYADKVVVSKFPDMSKVKPSEKQLAQRLRMKEATAFALGVLRTPEIRAAFEAGLLPGESVYHKAKKSYFLGLKK